MFFSAATWIPSIWELTKLTQTCYPCEEQFVLQVSFARPLLVYWLLPDPKNSHVDFGTDQTGFKRLGPYSVGHVAPYWKVGWFLQGYYLNLHAKSILIEHLTAMPSVACLLLPLHSRNSTGLQRWNPGKREYVFTLHKIRYINLCLNECMLNWVAGGLKEAELLVIWKPPAHRLEIQAALPLLLSTVPTYEYVQRNFVLTVPRWLFNLW